MKKTLVRVDWGWHPTQLCGDYKKPWGSLMKQSVFHWKYIQQFFFRGNQFFTLSWGVHKMGGEVSSIFRWRKRGGFAVSAMGLMGPFYSELLKSHHVKSQKRFSNCRITLQGINISHLGDLETHLQNCLGKGYVSSQEGIVQRFCLVLIWGFPGSVGCFKFGEANNPQTSSASALHLKMDVVGGQTCWVFLKCSPQHF